MGSLLISLVLALGLRAPQPPQTPQTAPTVAAASDLQFALKDVETAFEAAGGAHVEIVFGSSGTLSQQIKNGAPFQLFFSADESFVQDLATAGLTQDAGALYGIGRIVLFAPTGSPLEVDDQMKGLAALLARGGVTQFAIANPDHAPYGRAAQEALTKHQLWAPLQPKLVLGENISQAAQFATAGNAVGGIIAYSLALAPNLKDKGKYALLPESDHAPLRQRMVRMKNAGPAATAFYQFVQQPAAREILKRYGFALPAQ